MTKDFKAVGKFLAASPKNRLQNTLDATELERRELSQLHEKFKAVEEDAAILVPSTKFPNRPRSRFGSIRYQYKEFKAEELQSKLKKLEEEIFGLLKKSNKIKKIQKFVGDEIVRVFTQFGVNVQIEEIIKENNDMKKDTVTIEQVLSHIFSQISKLDLRPKHATEDSIAQAEWEMRKIATIMDQLGVYVENELKEAEDEIVKLKDEIAKLNVRK